MIKQESIEAVNPPDGMYIASIKIKVVDGRIVELPPERGVKLIFRPLADEFNLEVVSDYYMSHGWVVLKAT